MVKVYILGNNSWNDGKVALFGEFKDEDLRSVFNFIENELNEILYFVVKNSRQYNKIGGRVFGDLFAGKKLVDIKEFFPTYLKTHRKLLESVYA